MYERPLTYEEWVAQQYQQDPYTPTLNSARPAPGDIARMALDNGGKEYLRNSLMSSGGAPSAYMSTGAPGEAAGYAVGTSADGGILTSTGATIPGTEAAGAFDLAGIGGAGNAYFPALGLVGGVDVLRSDYGPGRGLAQGAASGAAIGSYFGVPGALTGAAIGGTIGGIKGLLKHESTRDAAKRHTEQLLGMGQDDPTYQAYARGMRGQYDSAPPNPSKPFAGKYSSWDEYKKAGLLANDLTGVMGNIETYGPEWAKLTQAQREAVTQANIDAGNYDSKKGEVLLKDKAKGMDLFNRLKASNFAAPTITPMAAPVTAQSAPTNIKIPKSSVPPQALKFRKV